MQTAVHKMERVVAGEVLSVPLFTAHECAQIVEIFSRQPSQPAALASPTGERRIDPSQFRAREAYIGPAALPGWITERIDGLWAPFRLGEPLRFNTYRFGDHFHWHVDRFQDWPASRRVITMSLQLSDPADYAGGKLLVRERGHHSPVQAETAAGVATVFDAGRLHCVEPVTAGTRRALVCWSHGPA